MDRDISWKETHFSGMMKCSRDQSSLSEFWRGVPVISSLWLDLKSIKVLYSKESSFFNRWASSTPRKAQLMLPKTVCRKRRKKQALRSDRPHHLADVSLPKARKACSVCCPGCPDHPVAGPSQDFLANKIWGEGCLPRKEKVEISHAVFQ